MLGLRRAGRRIADVVDLAYTRVSAPRRSVPAQRVLAVGIYKSPDQLVELVRALDNGLDTIDFRFGAMADSASGLEQHTIATHMTAGKFQNANRLLEGVEQDYDWLLIVDDDVRIPPHFLSLMIEIASALDFSLSQPAQSRFSNANWQITRRRFLSLARETSFVEIGPVTLVRADAMKLLLPFPQDLRWGWGLDFHWAHVVKENGLRMGIIDAATVVHASRKVASTYSWDAAQIEGREYLATVGHLPPDVARGHGHTTHRRISVLNSR